MKYFIWALTMGLISLFIELGAIPWLCVAIAVYYILDFVWRKFEERSNLKKGKLYRCPHCNSINEVTNEYCVNCGLCLKTSSIDQELAIKETDSNFVFDYVNEALKTVRSDTTLSPSEECDIKHDLNTPISEPETFGIDEEHNNNEVQTDYDAHQEKESKETEVSNFAIEEEPAVSDSVGQEAEKTENKKICFCRYCGNKLDSDYIYCNKCGKKIT